MLVAVLSLTACDLLTAPSVATTIMLSPSEVTFDGLGDDLRVNATVKDQHGNVMRTTRSPGLRQTAESRQFHLQAS